MRRTHRVDTDTNWVVTSESRCRWRFTVALTLVYKCTDMSVFEVSCRCRRQPVKTYSTEGILTAPSGLVWGLLCYTACYSFSSVCHGVRPTNNFAVVVLLRFVLTLDNDQLSLCAFKPVLSYWIHTHFCYMWIARHKHAWFAFPLFVGHLFYLLVIFPFTVSDDCFIPASGLHTVPKCSNNYWTYFPERIHCSSVSYLICSCTQM